MKSAVVVSDMEGRIRVALRGCIAWRYWRIVASSIAMKIVFTCLPGMVLYSCRLSWNPLSVSSFFASSC